MSETQQSAAQHGAAQHEPAQHEPVRSSSHVDTRGQTAWVGWVVFAGMMLILVGSFHVIAGLVALFRDQVLLVASSGLVVDVDYTAWGWAHIIWGGLAILVGACLLAGQVWARVVAVVVALLSAIVNIMFLPAYPVWSAIMVAVDVLVIWAITVHGSEIKTP